MTYVGELFLASLVQNKINKSRSVVETHVDVVKVPVLSLGFVHSLVGLRESVASVVAKPDIVASVDQSEGWRQVSIVGEPELHVT